MVCVFQALVGIGEAFPEKTKEGVSKKTDIPSFNMKSYLEFI